jgi:PAS domain S-box-containing protein
MQQRLRALIETSPAGIITVNALGIIELANQGASELLFRTDGDLTGQPISRFVPELENVLRPSSGGKFRTSMQCQVQRESGETFLADVWFSTYNENGNSKLAAIIGDVTEEFGEAPSVTEAPGGPDRPDLNTRQIAVLRLVFEGLSYREIASRLEITPSAVKNTLQQLHSKMGTHNRSQMIRVSLERYRDLL